jgi:hypothetical protein
MATRKTGTTEEGARKTAGAGKAGGAGEAAAKGRAAGKGAGQAAADGKGAAAKTQPTGAAASGGAKRTAAPRSKKPDLRSDLRDFAAARPQGWGHEDWVGFLDNLRERGHNVEDRDQVGHMLEQERLSLVLEKVPGMGAQRVRSIAEKFGNLWQLRQADADRIAREANVPRPLAEKVAEAVRG